MGNLRETGHPRAKAGQTLDPASRHGRPDVFFPNNAKENKP